MLDTLYPLKMTPLPGYWDADHDRPRTRNTRHSNSQCTNAFISKSPTFSLRTTILLLAPVSLAPHRNYTTRQIGNKMPVAPLWEWISRRAKRLNCQVTDMYGQKTALIHVFDSVISCLSMWYYLVDKDSTHPCVVSSIDYH